MEIKQVQLKKQEVVIDILCDICGKSCKVNEGVIENDLRVDNGEKTYEFSYMNLSAYWGYYSEHNDEEKWTAQVCEKCVDEKLSFITFKKEHYNSFK